MRGQTRPHRSRAQKPRGPSCWLHAAAGQIRSRSPALLRILRVVPMYVWVPSWSITDCKPTLPRLPRPPQKPSRIWGCALCSRSACRFRRAAWVPRWRREPPGMAPLNVRCNAPAHGLFCWVTLLTTRRKPCSWGLGAVRAHAPSQECHPCASKTESPTCAPSSPCAAPTC